MEPVNILDARNNLSQLVSAATNGDDVIIAKRGRPLVRLVPVEHDAAARTAESLAIWLTRNPPPPMAARETSELDAQIAAERDAWQ
jgi:prevent-host-death family protein